MLNEKTSQFASENGHWTAMAIGLPDGSYTRRVPSADNRLRRLLQLAADASKKPIDQCRVLDLACLEGHYAIEFAAQGAEAVGTEGRAISVAKCNYAKEALGLTRLSFIQDDVRDFSLEKYGKFDIIVCSGILYHLPAEDAWELIKSMREACSGLLLLDTFVSFSGRVQTTVDILPVRGHHYHEHSEHDDTDSFLWASLDNSESFWFTVPSLVNLLTKAGFTSVTDVLSPVMPGNPSDRKTYLAFAGEPVTIKTSNVTNETIPPYLADGDKPRVDASQSERSALHKAAKRLLPQSVKDIIKPALRMLRILPPDPTPYFNKRTNG